MAIRRQTALLGLVAVAAVVVLAVALGSGRVATPTASGRVENSGAPSAASSGDASTRSSAFAATCDRMKSLSLPVGSDTALEIQAWADLASVIGDAAQIARTTTVSPDEQSATAAIADELDGIAAALRVGPSASPDRSFDPAEDPLARLQAAADFAAGSPLGPMFDCLDPTGQPGMQRATLIVTTAGPQLPAGLAGGWVELTLRNSSPGTAGMALVQLAPGVDAAAAQRRMSTGDAPDSAILAQLARIEPIGPGQEGKVVLFLPSGGSFAVLVLDAAGAILGDAAQAAGLTSP